MKFAFIKFLYYKTFGEKRMKKISIVLVLMLSVFALFAQGFSFSANEEGFSMSLTGEEGSSSETKVTVNNSGQVIDQIVVKLEELQAKYNAKLNKLDGKRVNNIIDDIYTLLSLLPDNSDLVKPETNTSTQTSPAAGGTVNININTNESQTSQTVAETTPISNKNPMSASDFSNLINRINGESFGDDQLRVLRTAAKNHDFSVSQIVRILDCFDFSEEKISALSISYPGCVDPENNYEILDAFTYSDDKSEAERIINAD
jgi:hypothetical protein